MDLRDFFDNLEEKLMNFENTFIDGIFDQRPQNIRPRDLMLKNSHKNKNIDNFFAPSNTIHSQGQSIFQEFMSGPNGVIEEKIVIKDSLGNEKIITKHSENGKTISKEVHKKDNEILVNNEMISDIGDNIDNLEAISKSNKVEFKKNDEPKSNQSRSYLSYLWPF